MTIAEANPLLSPWAGPYQMPDFDRIRPEHFPPAFEAALSAHRAEAEAVAAHKAQPNFANVIEALERSGRLLARVAPTFFTLAGANTSPEIQAIEREITPALARHSNAIYTNAALFERVEAVYARRESSGLSREQVRLVERYRRAFLRAGARLDEAGKARMGEITQRLASLTTQFSQNVLADESGWRLVLENEDDCAGLPKFLLDAAAQAASDAGLPGRWAITLSRSSVEPFLQFSQRRDLREKAFRAWTARGAGGGANDNRGVIAEIVRLRDERARLLGFKSFADFKLDDSMAKSSAAVRDLLMAVWEAARAKAEQERDALNALARADGLNDGVAPWDWRFYSEKLRRARHDLDEAALKPYFQLENMIEAAFDAAGRLFGLSFVARKDIRGYHPDLRAWEAFGPDGRPIGLFLGDYFSRPSKRSGAWMTSFRNQERFEGTVLPVVFNVMNFAKAQPGEPALLSIDDARTLFHEFGHALHGLLSNVTYPSLAGTSVNRDFVELPSQLYEHWLLTPEMLDRYARHARNGRGMPQALLKKLMAARNFNNGFATVEYLASAIFDMELHEAAAGDGFDVDEFEAATMSAIGMPQEIVMRHRPCHFLHLFSGDGYAAGYYSYMWSEVMDADAFGAFEETGDLFDAATAARLRDCIYSVGGSVDPTEAYMAFRGRMPAIDSLLEKRGLKQARRRRVRKADAAPKEAKPARRVGKAASR